MADDSWSRDLRRFAYDACLVAVAAAVVRWSLRAAPIEQCAGCESDAGHRYMTEPGRARSDGAPAQPPIRRDDLYFSSVHHAKRSVHRDRLLFTSDSHSFAIVADLDRASRDPEQFLWRSYLQKGTLKRDAVRKTFRVEWTEMLTLASNTAMRNRSMELSELVQFGRVLLAPCDITGLIWKIVPSSGEVFQRFAVADGSGDFSKPFKMEWATVKDGALWVGSPGFEWLTADGRVVHRNAEWVKTIGQDGLITNYDWGPIYQTLRTAANASSPGYLWHEAVHWDPRSRRWIFLPRKQSSLTPYSPKADETQGTNLLLIADEDFQDIKVSRIGPLEPEFGFTTVRKVPGTDDLFMALKVKEREMDGSVETETKLCVFDLSGEFHTEPAFIAVGATKYEGLEFLNTVFS